MSFTETLKERRNSLCLSQSIFWLHSTLTFNVGKFRRYSILQKHLQAKMAEMAEIELVEEAGGEDFEVDDEGDRKYY